MPEPASFNDLPGLAQHLRGELENKKYILIYAYNGVGKTRLSTEFKNSARMLKMRTSAIRSTSTPSPKTCSCGTTT